MELVLLIVWVATQVISKTYLEKHCAKNVVKIRSPTSVDVRLVILAKWVKKVIPAVPNASVVMLVKQGRVLAVNANNVRLVNLVNQTIQELIRVHRVHRANTKKKKDKPRVTDVF